MGIGPTEIVVFVLMILCSLVLPVVVLVAFLTLFRRQEKLEQELRQLRENSISAEERPPSSM